MATTKEENPEAQKMPELKEVPQVQEIIPESVPSHMELLLDRFMEMDFVLVQWIGAKTVSKLAPSPSGVLRQLGESDYGLVAPKQWLLVHKEDAKFKKFYRRPTAKEKPAKSDVIIEFFGRKGLKTRVRWPGMPVDTLDPFNR